MARFVVVACEVVALSAVKFWSDVEPVARMFDAVRPPLNVCAPVKVLVVYVFGIVVDEFTKSMALVVENARPREEKYEAEVVEKKFLVSFHASADVVEKPRPAAAKTFAEVVEKKNPLSYVERR